MNRSYSKIRHIQESNLRLEGRLLKENEDGYEDYASMGDTTRFKALLESTMGNAKPLVSEQAETKVAGPIGVAPLQYYIYNKGGKFYIYQTNATQKTPILMQGTTWSNNGQGYNTQDEAEEIIQNNLSNKPSDSDEDTETAPPVDINEGITITDEDFPFPDNPKELNKFHVEEIFKVANSADEATEMIKDYYPNYYFEEQKDMGYGKTMAFMSPEGEEIAGKYIIGCCGGRGNFENMDRFKRSDDAFYDPRKRY